jgi:hypothetical protein
MKSLTRQVMFEAGMALLCLVLTAFFFHSALFPRTKTFLSDLDNTYQYYPRMHKLARDWRAAAPPLWDFSVEAGLPFPGELETAAFYPINILYVWLTGIPTPAKLDLLILLHFTAAMWGMTLFLRQRGVGRWASLFGGAVFSWVGPVAARATGQANTFAGLIYLPWILYFFERGLAAKNSWRSPWTGLAGLMLALSLLAGHPQPFIHNSLMLGFFALFLLFEQRAPALSWTINLRRMAGAIFTVAVVAFLFAYVQLASSYEYFARAYRWVGLDHPVRALQTVMPMEIYKQYSFPLRALLSAFTARIDGEGGTLYITIIGFIFACLGLRVRGRWRWFALSVSGFAILVAVAGNTPFGWLIYRLPVLNMVREPARILYLYQFCFAALAAFGIQMVLNRIPQPSGRLAIFIIITWVFASEAQQNAYALKASTKYPLTADQVYKRTPLIGFLEERDLANPGMYRVVAKPNEQIPNNAGDVFRFSTAIGYRATKLITYFDLLNKNWSPSAENLDRFATRYVVTDEPIDGLTFLASFNGSLLYECPTVRPVFRWGNSTDGVSSNTIGPVKWGRNWVKVQVTTSEPSKLIFVENQYPGWHARVSGVAAAIGPSESFMCVTVPAGTSTVQWSYWPWWLIPGMVCWLLGAVILAASLFSGQIAPWRGFKKELRIST